MPLSQKHWRRWQKLRGYPLPRCAGRLFPCVITAQSLRPGIPSSPRKGCSRCAGPLSSGVDCALSTQVSSDLSLYKGLLSKLSAAKELQQEFLVRERKRAAERAAEKAAKAGGDAPAPVVVA